MYYCLLLLGSSYVCSSSSWLSATSASCVTPTTVPDGTYYFSIKVSGFGTTVQNAALTFTIVTPTPTPTISSLSTSGGTVGIATTVVITGTNFGVTSNVVAITLTNGINSK